jgi:hypothetical protein
LKRPLKKLERAKGVETIRNHRPVSAETGVMLHESMSNTGSGFLPARSQTTYLRSKFVIRSHAMSKTITGMRRSITPLGSEGRATTALESDARAIPVPHPGADWCSFGGLGVGPSYLLVPLPLRSRFDAGSTGLGFGRQLEHTLVPVEDALMARSPACHTNSSPVKFFRPSLLISC